MKLKIDWKAALRAIGKFLLRAGEEELKRRIDERGKPKPGSRNGAGAVVLLLALLPLGGCAGLIDLARRVEPCPPGTHRAPDGDGSQSVCVPDAPPSPPPTTQPPPPALPGVPASPKPMPTPEASPSPEPEPSPWPEPQCSRGLGCDCWLRVGGQDIWRACPPSPAPVPSPTPTPKPPVCKSVPGVCNTCDDVIAQAIEWNNWNCPRTQGWPDRGLDVVRDDGNPVPREPYNASIGRGACYNRGDAKFRVDRQCNRLAWDSDNVLNPAGDGYLGPICNCSTPSPSPTPSASPTPGATPKPGPTPGTCPTLVRWGGGVHSAMFANHQESKTPDDKPQPVAGGFVHLDSTPRFGSGNRGLPCNDEHHAVCERDGLDHGPNWRPCEDPRGPVWRLVRGNAKTKVDGFGLKVGPLASGHYAAEVCPRDDVQDALGQPVRTDGDACSTIEWDVP